MAAIMVFTWHFISRFTRTTFRYWTHGPSHYILQGMSGKFGVIVFCVVLGYFAAKSGGKKGSLAKYTLNRYIQFALMGVFVNTLYLTVPSGAFGILQCGVHVAVRIPGKPGWNAADNRVCRVAGGMCCCRIFCE